MRSEWWRQQFIERYIRRCRHFTGTCHQRCAAGIEYVRFREIRGQLVVGQPIPVQYETWHMPCFEGDPDPWACESRVSRTLEDAEAYLANADVHHDRYTQIRAAIVMHAHDQAAPDVLPLTGSKGSFPCPIKDCDGEVFYAIAPNHHITARCTGKCEEAWIE